MLTACVGSELSISSGTEAAEFACKIKTYQYVLAPDHVLVGHSRPAGIVDSTILCSAEHHSGQHQFVRCKHGSCNFGLRLHD